MPILLSCGCGKKMRVRTNLAASASSVPNAAGDPGSRSPHRNRPRRYLASPPPLPAVGGAERVATPFWVNSDELLALSDEALLLASLDAEKLEAVSRSPDARRRRRNGPG